MAHRISTVLPQFQLVAVATAVAWLAGCSLESSSVLGPEYSLGPDAADPDAPTVYDDPRIHDHLDLPSAPYHYNPDDLPAHFQNPRVADRINTPDDNPITDGGATLGRVLFYDPLLSANASLACADCHRQDSGFSDPRQLSRGFDGGLTGRNSMSLINLRYYEPGTMFWDERAATVEHQVLLPIQSSVEMGMDLDDLALILSATEYYPVLFERAFGDSNITSERISLALAQFVRSIVSYRSRYDQGLAAVGNPGAPFPGFSQQENIGKALFLRPPARPGQPGPGGAACAVCHLSTDGPPGPGSNTALFYMDAPRHNGLSSDDLGVGAITGRTEDNGKFKSPSLRNVAQTGPYMHDGSIATLREVVEHYNDGVESHPNLDRRLRRPDGTPLRLNLSDDDIDAVVAFLGTLSDDTLASDPRFSDPFR